MHKFDVEKWFFSYKYCISVIRKILVSRILEVFQNKIYKGQQSHF